MNYWGHNNLAAIIVMITLLAMLFILCLLFHKKQPLRSRGMIPWVVVGSQILSTIQVLLESYTILSLENQRAFGCILTYLIFRTARVIAPVVIVIHTLRFLLILNLNHMKSVFCQEIGDSDTVEYNSSRSYRIKILRALIAPRASLLALVFFCAIWTLFCLIELAAFRFQCTEVIYYNISNVAMIGVSIIFWIIGGLELLYDIILNRKLKCNLLVYFFKFDVYAYRLEVFFAYGVSTLLLLFAIIKTFAPGTYEVAVYTILQWMLTFTMSIFPLIITIAWETKKYLQKFRFSAMDEYDEGLVDQIMNNSNIRDLLVQYAKQEWSLENIMIWVKFFK